MGIGVGVRCVWRVWVRCYGVCMALGRRIGMVCYGVCRYGVYGVCGYGAMALCGERCVYVVCIVL